jgi:flagellar basal body-associated protein FliL
METKRILGIIIIVVLLAAIITAVYITAFGNAQQENNRNQITSSYKLTNAEIQGINYVNINLISNTSGVDISFQNNSDSIYDITVNRDNNSKDPTVTYNKQGYVLNVNIILDSESTTLVLGNERT